MTVRALRAPLRLSGQCPLPLCVVWVLGFGVVRDRVNRTVKIDARKLILDLVGKTDDAAT